VIVLAIESATETVGAAVHAGEGAESVVRVTGRRRHAETLAPAIAEAMGHLGVAMSSLDAIAVDVGPGLFTGLRVGVAMAKGLAQGLSVGLIGLNSLELLAAAAYEAGWPGTVLAVLDARRGEVFAAHYRRGGTADDVEALVAPGRHGPDRVVPDVLGAAEGPVLACGDGALRYSEQLSEGGRVTMAGATLRSPDPAVLLAVALARLERGAPTLGAAELQPLYLREPDVRIGWAQRAPAGLRGG
jgi:tRNA threonylcarbamoyladenosine biosynthesis protein TsaB